MRRLRSSRAFPYQAWTILCVTPFCLCPSHTLKVYFFSPSPPPFHPPTSSFYFLSITLRQEKNTLRQVWKKYRLRSSTSPHITPKVFSSHNIIWTLFCSTDTHRTLLTQPTGVARQVPSQVYRRPSLIYICFHFHNRLEYSNNYFTSVDAVMSSSGQQSSITKLAQVNEQAWLTLGKYNNILLCNIAIWNPIPQPAKDQNTIYVTFIIRVTPFNESIEGKLLFQSEKHIHRRTHKGDDGYATAYNFYILSLPFV